MNHIFEGLVVANKQKEENNAFLELLNEEEKLKFKKVYHAKWKIIISLIWMFLVLISCNLSIDFFSFGKSPLSKVPSMIMIVLIFILTVVLLFVPFPVFWGPRMQIKTFGKTIKQITLERSGK